MKTRVWSVLCALFLILSVAVAGPVRAVAVRELFFIAVNDSAPELSGESTPLWIGNTAYIPCTLFDRRVTGVYLGISYSWSNEAVLLFAGERTLEFDIAAGKAYGNGGARIYEYQAVIRNGRPYVPAVNACGYFGLQTTMLYTSSGPLLRLKDGNQELSDKLFMDAVEPLFATRLAQYNSADSSSGGGQGGTTGEKPGTGIPPEDGDDPEQEKVVYTAVRVTGGLELEGITTAFNARGVKGLFFFAPEDLSGYDRALRRLAGSGHRIGLIPRGETLREQLESLEAGNALLAHILRQETVFVLSPGQSAEWEASLRDEGYLPWRATVWEEGRGTAILVEQIKKQSGRARVLFQAQYGSGSLSALLRGMQAEPFDLRQPRETSY